MNLFKYKTVISALIFILSISCAQKNAPDEPPVENVPQSESVNNTEPITVDISDTGSGSQQKTVIEQITNKPDDENTAVTYPKIEKIKTYSSTIKEEEWFLVGGVTGPRAYSVFVDPETIESKNDLTISWSKLEFEKSQKDEDGLSYQSVKINSSIDCKNRTYSYTDSKFYDALGRLVENQPTPYEARPISEGTVSATIADFVCGYQLNKPEEK